MSTTKRRVAVIGCGDISAVHLAVIAQSEAVDLVAVCDSDPERLAATASSTRVRGFADHRTMFVDARPDIVHICTPHSEHSPQAIDALEAGIHVLLEKPLAHSVGAVDALVQAAKRSTAKLGVCLQNRYNPTVQRLHELLESGATGPVIAASATVLWSRTPAYYESRPWRGRWATGGGGLLMNQAIHTVDLLLWLLGDAISVTGGAGTRAMIGHIEVEDTADMVIDHAGGVRSVLFASLANAVNEPVTIDIMTERAVIRLAEELVVTWQDGRVERVAQDAATGERSYWGLSHQTLINDFYATLDEPGPFWIDAAEARKSVDVVQSVYRQAGLLPEGVA